jgi:hypothetical protein
MDREGAGGMKLNRATLDAVIEEVRQFKSETIIQGTPDAIIDAHVDGVNKGYNDAVKQIVEHLERMRSEA